jgi:diguanylate cyclase
MPALIVSLPPWVGALAIAVAVLAIAASVKSYRTSRRLREKLRQVREASERQADVDAATGLASPRAFARALDLATARADRGEAAVAVIYVGVDDLRTLGNEHGTAVAQQALVALARRLQAVGGRHGAAARMGPDEFALLAHGPTAAGEEMSRRTADVLAAPVEVDGHPFPLVSSVGFAVYPEHGASTRIVRMACAAMRSVRRAGGGTFAEFEPRMAEAAATEAALARDLRNAVQRRQLTLYYQPKVDATTQQVTAAEALLRWQHPQRGMISPAVFIPLAERTGLIQEIGGWVLEEALRQAAAWRDKGLRMRVAINVSGHQMRAGDFVEQLERGLAQHGLSAGRFTCEITETVAMEDTATTQRAFTRLGELGVHVSIDDFGTGHSSLAMLRRLPVAELKIDRAFVSDLADSEGARSIALAVMQMAKSLGLRVVAEGVETEAQRDILIGMGCDELQGYLYGKPMPAASLAVWAMDDTGAAPMSFRPSLFKATQPVE